MKLRLYPLLFLVAATLLVSCDKRNDAATGINTPGETSGKATNGTTGGTPMPATGTQASPPAGGDIRN